MALVSRQSLSALRVEVFVARPQGLPIRICQQYPCFAPVSLSRLFVLTDPFDAQKARRRRAAAALLRAEVDRTAAQGASQFMLQTLVTNLPAQRLYEREAWVRDNDSRVYELPSVRRGPRLT